MRDVNPARADDAIERGSIREDVALEKDPRRGQGPFVVGVGASAGGLEALEAFFDAVSPDSQAAYVVVQHLSPDFKSLMGDLLPKHTPLEIHRVTDRMPIEPASLYLIPPRKNMIMSGNKLLLSDQDVERALNYPIDIFLRSMAECAGARCAGVILSGTGSDGTRGIQSIKEAGGLVIVQEPESAKFDGMPRSAIATDAADFVLPPGEIPERIEAYRSHSIEFLQDQEEEQVLGAETDPLRRILVLLLRAKGLDFRQYKGRTIRRRIQRRMTILQLGSLEEYFQLVHADAGELDTLFQELLIGVTEFFRDPESFAVLAKSVVPALVESAQDDQLRVWVTGCSTGEEAYSIAILLHEYLDARKLDLTFKIFATDVDPRAIARAGEGLYPQALATHVSPKRLERYFEPEGDQYRIARVLRERVVFAVHNLAKDPPFTRMDLVTCRNLLIYLEPQLQARILHFLHFALRTQGYLMLGASESLVELDGEFDDVNNRWKVFRKRRDVRLALSPEIPIGTPGSSVNSTLLRGRDTSNQQGSFARVCTALLRGFVPAALLLSESFELLHIFGDASGYLRLPEGRMSQDAMRMFGAEARVSISTALHRAAKSEEEVTYRDVRFGDGESGVRLADIQVRPLAAGLPGDGRLFLVLLGPRRERTLAASEDTYEASEQTLDRIDALEKELQFTRENLQATIEELETANEELQSTNEELLASNEELQSTNEELHSVNEELYTVNAEHQKKIDELTELSNDVENLFQATEIGTIFLDEHLHIRKFTPAVKGVVSLIENDIGRPIAHLRHSLRGIEITDVAAEVLETGVRVEREVTVEHGRAMLLRVLPYSTSDEQRAGVVLTFVDLLEVREAQDSLVKSEHRLRELVENMEDVLWIGSADGREVEFASSRFEPLWGRPVEALYEDAACWFDPILEEDRDRVRIAWLEATTELDVRFRIRDPEGGLRWLHAQTYLIPEGEESARVAGILRDVTNDREQEEKLIQVTRELENQAFRDALTGLINRRGAQRELAREAQRATRTGAHMCAIMVDLDSFKQINDNFGHATGDLVLQGVATRMQSCLRPQDLAARIGGDEFMVILPETREAEARMVAERLRLSISEQPLATQGETIRVTASLGVAAIPEDVVSIEEVLVQTRGALKSSKRSGKNQVSTKKSGIGVEETQLIERVVREDCFRSLAQEIRRLDDSSVAGYEMLSRGPQGAYETPNALFRLSQENNILGMVDLKCLRKCIETSIALNGEGRIHLNIFPTTLLDTPVERLIDLFEENGGGSRYCIEISEQQFLGEPCYLRRPVEELRKAGVNLAVDDVGFGRSSLESLILLEPDVVKIDYAFVHGIATDQAKRRNLERLIRSTSSLTSEVIAEGVEMMDERDMLAEMGVTYAQGFLWGRPSAVAARN